MEDPRIDELLQHVDAVDENGEPTSIALIARSVSSYLEAVENLREELQDYHSSVSSLEQRAENLTQSINKRSTLRGDITDMAQTAAMQAAFSTTTARGAQLRKDANEKRKNLTQFEDDFAKDQARLKEVMRAIQGKQARLMETRDQIARRMNIIDALLQRAEIEWPSYFYEENERLKAKQSNTSASPVRHVSKRRPHRRIIRRRRAS
jgi:predicted  nucleic acid-binding Zn-ribbon protein